MNPVEHISQPRSSRVMGIFLVAGLASTLVIWGGQTYWPLLFALMGLGLSVWHRTLFLPDVPALRQAVMWLVGGFFSYSALRMGSYVLHGNRFNVEPLIPFLLFPFLALTVVRFRVAQRYFWHGVMLAGFATLSFAAYQHFGLGIARANGHVNAIPFGDTAVVFALVALVGATGTSASQSLGPWLRLSLIASALASSYASLLSGSKGGWLSLLMVIGFGCYRGWQAMPIKFRALAAILALAIALSAAFAAPKHVVERVQSGVRGGVHWFQTGEITESSVSYRLEMWALGLRIFKESPWTGMNESQWLARKAELIESGEFPKNLLSQQTLDSEYVGALSTDGILGLSASLFMLLMPLLVFWRLSKVVSARSHDLVQVGIWLPILFFEFGLSISLWGVSAFRQLYASWLVLLLALVIVEESKETAVPRTDGPPSS